MSPPGRDDAARAALLARLSRRRALARWALWWEDVWPRAWPPLAVLGLFLTAAWGGLFLALAPGWHLGVLLGFLIAFVWTACAAFRGFAHPERGEADRRLERASGLAHRPLAAITDRPTGDDPTALALFRLHQERAAATIRRLRVGAPHPGLPARDRRAFRAAVALAAFAAFVVAGSEAGERLRRAVSPAFAVSIPENPLRIEAWITPPAYTGAAPIFLDPTGGPATAPVGSRLQVSLAGGTGAAPELRLDSAVTPLQALDAGAWGAELTLSEGGRLVLRRNGGDLARWALTVQADTPPRVAWSEPAARALRGLSLRLPWRAEDDWGVAALQAEIRLDARPGAAPVVIELPLPGASPKQARGVAQPDLAAHAWAGLPVTIRLVARDGAGQQGVSDEARLVLPERAFNHPVAQALIAVRKALSLDPEARVPARAELDRIAGAPEAFEHDTTTFLALRSARHRLLRDRRPDAVAEVQELLWETALALEEGRAERTARALAEARQALREAIEEAERDGVTPEERRAMEERINELREAIRRHLEALAERLQQENAEAIPFDPSQRLMDQRELDRRTQRMREAARQGRTEEARRELAELERMLQALEEGRAMRAEPQERRQQRERGQQQMGALHDMVRRQSDMLDRSHQRADAEDRRQSQDRRTLPQNRLPNSPQQQQREQERQADRGQAQQDARQQRALRRALGELMQQFGDLTGEVPEQLGRADQAMREAQEALGEGRDARPSQQRALRELTEGGRQMAQSMRQRLGQGEPGEDEEGEGEGEGEGMAEGSPNGGEGMDQGQQQGEGRDPLGRRTRDAPGSAEQGGDTRVPSEAELLRTRQIQDELRRRGAEKERPPAELDYIERLLRRF